MKTVYRVEHIAYRHGPYNSSRTLFKNDGCRQLAHKLGTEFDWDHNPPPPYDGIKDHGDDHYCGFASLDDLFIWFNRWLEDLQENDYHVTVFEVEDEDVLKGRKQVMFRRKKYRRRAAIRFDEIENLLRKAKEC
ncbi:MAG: hypothetical protein ACYSW8_26975 [Planctomycetota bacterium]|jgi:hypothetical protein